MGGGKSINMVSYGGGVNSTALLIGLHQHRIPVDLILFADTGAEHPHTYAYLDIMDRWLKDHGMPPITRVYKNHAGQQAADPGAGVLCRAAPCPPSPTASSGVP